MIAGLEGRYQTHLGYVRDVIGLDPDARCLAALSLLILPRRSFFLCDTYVVDDPRPEEIAEMTILAAEEVRRFGLVPRVALLSHSSAGSFDHVTASKMRQALELVWQRAPELEADGEMHADAALNDELRARLFPNGRLRGAANLLVAPSLDAANIAFNLVKEVADGLHVGPILLGTACPAHILTPSVTSRGVLNMSALAVVQAQLRARDREADESAIEGVIVA
jgi:malate dehydrogenase (oxaloacetate-decarboxylating)(NADP+)